MKKLPTDWTKPDKELARRIAIDHPERIARTALFMPAESMRCVSTAMELGRINRNTQCIFVEIDPAIMKQMQTASKKFAWVSKPIFVQKSLHEVDLAELIGPRRIDFAFLDLCAPLSAEITCWIAGILSPMLARKFTVAITAVRTFRTVNHVSQLYDKIRKMCPSLIQHTHRQLREATVGGCLEGTEIPLYRPMQPGTYRRGSISTINGSILRPVYHESSLKNTCAMLLALAIKDPHITGCLEYGGGPTNGTRMSVLRFEDGGPRVPVSSSLNDLFLGWLEQHEA